MQNPQHNDGLTVLANSVTLNPVVHEGQQLFTLEDLGKALGYNYPKQSIGKIYQRNRKELKNYSVEVKLTSTDNKSYFKQAFTREGALIVSMLAKTNRAKSVRAWLAKLGTLAIEEAKQEAIILAKKEISSELLAAKPLWKKIARYKEMGLTNAEIGRLLGFAKDTIRKHARKMEGFGIIEPPANLAQMQARQSFLPGMEATHG